MPVAGRLKVPHISNFFWKGPLRLFPNPPPHCPISCSLNGGVMGVRRRGFVGILNGSEFFVTRKLWILLIEVLTHRAPWFLWGVVTPQDIFTLIQVVSSCQPLCFPVPPDFNLFLEPFLCRFLANTFFWLNQFCENVVLYFLYPVQECGHCAWWEQCCDLGIGTAPKKTTTHVPNYGPPHQTRS